MSEVILIFEREGREGIIAAGTYLIDAAKRFGIVFEDECDQEANIHFCSVRITSGAENLSAPTAVELEQLTEAERKRGERLACQTKIERPGEVVVMTKEKKQEKPSEPADHTDQYKKEFADMPLEKKIATLVQFEALALGETVSFIINSPFKVMDKVMDVMAEFGFKKEESEKEAVRPKEHRTEGKGAAKETKKQAKTSKKAAEPKPEGEAE